MKRIRQGLEALALAITFAMIRPLSIDTASNIGAFIGRTVGPRLRASERARRNLRLAFPEKDPAEIERILRAMWDNLGRVAAEYPHLGRITTRDAGRIDLVDIEPLYALRDEKKAGIIASAHLANWEIMPVITARHGIDLTIIVREPNNPFVRPLIDRLRGVAGGGRVPKGKAGAKKAIEVLRSGRVLGLLFDQKLNSGIPVPLFGIEAMTAPVPAQLALRMGCPLIPVRIERTGAGRFRITAHAALELPDSGDRRADAARLMLELNRILEDWIRAKPEEWFWLHRRWPDAAYLPRGTGKSGSGV